MEHDQRMRIAVAFAREAARTPSARLCHACVEVLAVTGAGITLMAGRSAGPMCVSSARIQLLEDTQFTTGAGPCQDAYRERRPVHAPRLDSDVSARWPAFVDAATATSIRSVHAYPLETAGVSVGTLTLYQEGEGEFTAAQHEDSLAVAEVLAETVLSLQAEAPAGQLAAGLEDAGAYRAEIYQASGMLAVQLQIPADDAMTRLRAHAFARGLPLGHVAAEIVSRRLTLSDDRDDAGGD